MAGIVIWLAGLLALVPAAAADSGDDFASNLFSDIAPLLALFGERFAQQFMSEAFNWLDHIIFAMAPLGILTALVGAIRVCGPPWLKAWVGRARENIATAEVDLMSSTSHEVCELWNGEAVVRTLGKPMVEQFVYLKAYEGERGEDGERTFGLYTLRNMRSAQEVTRGATWSSGKLGRAVMVSNGAEGPFMRLWKMIAGHRQGKDAEEGSPNWEPRTSKAPNILLNLHQGSRPFDLAFAAILGVVIQTGVLVYAGLITYHPRIKTRFLKAGNPIRPYAFPTMAVGTVVLVVGMMICSYVVEQSTVERKWIVPEGEPLQEARVMWLQKKHVVSDQSFNSFVLVAADPCKGVQTSHRRPPPKRWEARILSRVAETLPEALAFEGLRGLHWTSSIAQLAAVTLMAVLRAWVRRGLIRRPRDWRVTDEHEMDWLALGFATNPEFWDERATSDPEFREWEVATDAASLAYPGELEEDPGVKRGASDLGLEGDGEISARLSIGKGGEDDDFSLAQRAVKVRQRIGLLTGWAGPASGEAISVAIAIETVMNTFLDRGLRFTWSVEVKVGGKSEKIDFTVSREEEGWHAEESEIEAALSLWIFHIRHQKQKDQEHEGYVGEELSKRRLQRRDPVRGGRYRRVLGPGQEALRRDLDWWVGTGVATEVKTSEPADILTGFSGLKTEPPTNYPPTTIQAVSSAKLELFLAQHLFSAFMWAVAGEIPANWIETPSKRAQEPTKFDVKDAFSLSDHRTWGSCRIENAELLGLMRSV
ncbi:MAG: hypothetical protein M1839_003270 [Geoglossum umbratile]|nr:MAG: hypothetical protein M1839_003270 [Geoglossum umbratile]